MNQEEILINILNHLEELKKTLALSVNNVAPDWVAREHVKKFIGYGDTQMSALEKNGILIVAKIGKRKFYHKESIATMLKTAITRN